MFTDVSLDHPAYTAIKRFQEVGYVGGFPDGTFHPDEPMTRAQVVLILDRILQDVGLL
jgi:hypothetical protein